MYVHDYHRGPCGTYMLIYVDTVFCCKPPFRGQFGSLPRSTLTLLQFVTLDAIGSVCLGPV